VDGSRVVFSERTSVPPGPEPARTVTVTAGSSPVSRPAVPVKVGVVDGAGVCSVSAGGSFSV
jgi:hypothetical protein